MAVVLIVEDDALIRELTEMLIQDWGYQTFSAGDVDGALALLRSPQRFDLLFTDINLKNDVLDGCDLAQQSIKLRPLLHVLYTTGNIITAKMRARFVRGTSCLRKPYTPNQLQRSFELLFAA